MNTTYGHHQHLGHKDAIILSPETSSRPGTPVWTSESNRRRQQYFAWLKIKRIYCKLLNCCLYQPLQQRSFVGRKKYMLHDRSRDQCGNGTQVHGNGTELCRIGKGSGMAACGNGWEWEWKTSPVQSCTLIQIHCDSFGFVRTIVGKLFRSDQGPQTSRTPRVGRSSPDNGKSTLVSYKIVTTETIMSNYGSLLPQQLQLTGFLRWTTLDDTFPQFFLSFIML